MIVFFVVSALVAACSESAYGEPPGWRVAVERAGGSLGGFRDVGATGPGDAWVVRDGRPLLRWDGRGWRGQGGAAVPYLVTAAGPREAWQFVEHGRRLDARRWDGRTWQPHPIPTAGAHATAAVAAGPGDCWVAGLRFGPHGMTDVAWHFTDGRWRQVDVPSPITDLAAAGRNDVWALSSAGRLPSILHWTGHGWRRTPVPSIGVPERSRAGDATVELDDVAVTGRNEAYAVGAVVLPLNEGRVIREAVVLRWNGSTWRRLAHRPAETAYTRVAPDGAGGLWLVTQRQDHPDVLTHHAGGRWTPVEVPAVAVKGLANVPGTRDMWATAESRESGATRQLILSYR